eukprot:g9755.t2
MRGRKTEVDSLQRTVGIFDALIRKDMEERKLEMKRVWEAIDGHTHDMSCKIKALGSDEEVEDETRLRPPRLATRSSPSLPGVVSPARSGGNSPKLVYRSSVVPVTQARVLSYPTTVVQAPPLSAPPGWQVAAPHHLDEGTTARSFVAVRDTMETKLTTPRSTDTTLLGALGGALRVDEDLGMRHISFVVVASLERASYAVRMERVWMHAAANRIYLVDALIPGLPQSYQVVMNDGGQRGHKDGVAISRLMIWMNQVKHMYSTGGLPLDLRWLVILGDDVYINTARLFYFLAGHASADDHPVMFAHVLSDAEVYDFDVPCQQSAVVLSRSALELLSKHADLLVDVLAHHWIAAGGLSLSTLGQDDSAIHPAPFEAGFPNLQCELPRSDVWTYQELAERTAAERVLPQRRSFSHMRRPTSTDSAFGIRFCMPPVVGVRRTSLVESPVDGSELEPETLVEYFEERWPGAAEKLHEVLWEEVCTIQFMPDHWYFLSSSNTWLHRAADLASLPQPLPPLAFAFAAEPLNRGESSLLSGTAAERLQRPVAGGAKLTPALLKKLNIQLVHTPQLASLTGVVCSGGLTGTWSLLDVDDEMRQDLEMKAADRRFYAERSFVFMSFLRSNESSHLFLPSANDIPFGKTLSTRSMRSIQEEEPVMAGRSPSTTVPTPDAEYFGSPSDDRGFGSFSHAHGQGMTAKGRDSEDEEEQHRAAKDFGDHLSGNPSYMREELAWAKHTSIVTDYGEDVWGGRSGLSLQMTPPRLDAGGRRNSGQKMARGDSEDETGDTGPKKDPSDMKFTKWSSLLTDGGEDDVGALTPLFETPLVLSERTGLWWSMVLEMVWFHEAVASTYECLDVI